MTSIDPFKLLGEPSTWGDFGSGEHDADCDAERRSLCDHFVRRMLKGEKRIGDEIIPAILSGSSVAMAGFFIASGGGADALEDDAFDKWIALMTFAWYQALSAGAGKA